MLTARVDVGWADIAGRRPLQTGEWGTRPPGTVQRLVWLRNLDLKGRWGKTLRDK